MHAPNEDGDDKEGGILLRERKQEIMKECDGEFDEQMVKELEEKYRPFCEKGDDKKKNN